MKDPDFVAFSKKSEIIEPLKPDEGYVGGRVSTFKVRADVRNSSQKLFYYDYTSLYASIMKFEKYPIGYPDIIENPPTTDISNYYGIVKCDVLITKDIYAPPLPYKYKGRLYFPLCYTCLKNDVRSTCMHTEKERFLRFVWWIDEVKQAVELSQATILQVHEIWHFPKSGFNIFSKFIDYFSTQKTNYSGYPDHVLTPEDKKEYINKFHEAGIELNPNILELGKNDAMRSSMKLFPNAIYGKFGMKQNHNQKKMCYTKKEFHDIFFSDKYEVLNIQILAPNSVVHVEYKLVDEVFNSKISDVNIIVALATTAMGRMKLNLEITKLGDQICYCDTDSIIFLSGTHMPQLGDFIGDFKDETSSDDVIEVFESLGPKNYILSYRSGKTKLVAKGFTLNSKALDILNKSFIHKLINSFVGKKG